MIGSWKSHKNPVEVVMCEVEKESCRGLYKEAW